MKIDGSQGLSDRMKPADRHQISRLAFILAAMLIAVTAASLLFVGYAASEASNQQALKNEQQLFQNMLKERVHLLVREQLTFSRSDTTVRFAVHQMNPDFIRPALKSLWQKYGHHRSIIVTGDSQVQAESFSDYIHFVNRDLADTPQLMPLAKEAQRLYMAKRVRVPGGYSFASFEASAFEDIAAFAFVELDGKPALASAIPIIPDRETVTLPSGPPTLLISAKFVDGAFLKDLNAQLSFQNLVFERNGDLDEGMGSIPVSQITGETFGHFKWRNPPNDAPIWRTIVPVIIVLSFALGILALGIAWRIGRLTASLQASESQNRYLALHDNLTGLANRLHFNRALTTALVRSSSRPFGLLHCDLDLFKEVNDTYGHAAGDLVLITIAKRMQEIVSDRGLVCRMGGDEFVIIVHSSTDRLALQRLCAALIEATGLSVSLDHGQQVQVGLSIGIAVAPDNGRDSESLMAAADAALYASKKAGRGRMAFAETGTIEPLNEKVSA